MKISEMSLGYFGLDEGEILRLKRMFHSVEQIGIPFQPEYDLCYMDISYASHRVIGRLRNADVMPMIIKDYFEPPQEILDFLHPDSYLWLNHQRNYHESELTEKIEEYLKRFEERKREYQLFLRRAKGRPAPDIEEHLRKKQTKINCPADVWGLWKGWNRSERVVPASKRYAYLEESDSGALKNVWRTWKKTEIT